MGGAVSPELVLRWAATAGVLVTGAGFTTSLAPDVPPALIWGVAFVVFAVVAALMWRRRLDDLELERQRVQHRPDHPHRAPQTAEQQFSRRNSAPRDEPEPDDDTSYGPSYGP